MTLTGTALLLNGKNQAGDGAVVQTVGKGLTAQFDAFAVTPESADATTASLSGAEVGAGHRSEISNCLWPNFWEHRKETVNQFRVAQFCRPESSGIMGLTIDPTVAQKQQQKEYATMLSAGALLMTRTDCLPQGSEGNTRSRPGRTYASSAREIFLLYGQTIYRRGCWVRTIKSIIQHV